MTTSSANGPLRVGIGGPVGTGKTTMTIALARALAKRFDMAVITNDIYTREDAEALMRAQVLPAERVVGVETGGCLSLIHISEPTRQYCQSRMPASA